CGRLLSKSNKEHGMSQINEDLVEQQALKWFQEAELSYAYLHAVAAKAGMGCSWGNRHDDGVGVDATIRVRHDFGPSALLSSFTIDVQLKSTVQTPTIVDDRYSYPLAIKNYNELRDTTCSPLKMLVVLFLPSDHEQWLEVSAEQLVARRCAYWCGLHEAPASNNTTSQTIQIPTENLLTPQALLTIAEKLARREALNDVD
ncbi:MAG: DUF4365 domain-containing protein, partial [Candidatus Paceibacterota bacterium]